MSDSIETNETWQCPHCQEIHDEVMATCWQCGADKEGAHSVESDESTSTDKSADEIIHEYANNVQTVENGLKRVAQFRVSTLLCTIVFIIAVSVQSIALAIFMATVSTGLIVATFLQKMNLNKSYFCPACKSALTINTKTKGLLTFNLLGFTHCHHCGVMFTRES